MKLLIVSGSRNSEGQTATATAALAKGAQSEGCEVKEVFLPTLNLKRCRQCEDSGWGLCAREARCIIEDDLAGIVDRIRQADVVAFATPVYFSDLSESMKAFLDRFRRICIHGANKDRINKKPVVGICVAGGGGGGAPRCAMLLETTLATCGFDVVDMAPVRRQNLETKREVLRTMGAWLATKPSSQ